MLDAPAINADRLTAAALAHTVQEFPPPLNAGAFLVTESTRGPILPSYGTKERDRILRVYDQMEQNGLWQGAISGLIKRVRSTPWEIKGDPYWANYYQAVFQRSQFGKGWGEFVSLVLRDYLTQDYGGFIELIGPGEAEGPITGPLGDPWREPGDPVRYYGIAHKDTWRCYVTGNPTWPVVYYSLMTGSLHRMHHSRIRRMVDMPSPDERYFGIGLCALSRCIGVAAREIRMGRYIDAFLDDKPKPGINVFSGMTDQQFMAAIKQYIAKQSTDSGDLFGKVLNLFSMDIGAPLTVNSYPFAQTPEKFDFIKYVDLDVNAIALGLGVDRQDLWELAGRGLGSGSQSQILAQKSESKAYGDILQTLERLFNNDILPAGLEFRFKTKNTVGDTAQAGVDVQYASVATSLAAIPDMTTGAELRQMLSNKSQTFADAFTDEAGNVALADSDVLLPDQEVRLDDDAPAEGLQDKPLGPARSAPTSKPAQIPATTGQKDFQATRQEFINSIVELVSAADQNSRRRFGVVFRAQLRRHGQAAYQDGLIEGGVTDPLDEGDLAQVQHWTISQSDYVSQFANDVYQKGLSPAEVRSHADMWANKALQQMLDAGRMSADRNGMYEWVLGLAEKHCPTCKRLAGQRHRFKEWFARSLLPKSDKLDCNGYQCSCKLVKTTEAARGRF
jgi:GAF domain-containing protein